MCFLKQLRIIIHTHTLYMTHIYYIYTHAHIHYIYTNVHTHSTDTKLWHGSVLKICGKYPFATEDLTQSKTKNLHQALHLLTNSPGTIFACLPLPTRLSRQEFCTVRHSGKQNKSFLASAIISVLCYTSTLSIQAQDQNFTDKVKNVNSY